MSRSDVWTSTSTRAKPAFSLFGTPAVESLARRQWTASYLALTRVAVDNLEGHDYLAGMSDSVVNRISAQSEPPMMAPREAGAVRSSLPTELAEGRHYGVRLTAENLEKLASWTDLQVPFWADWLKR
ncbi:MAG TPA: hypothetical protein VLI39_10110 [Sedimentisphaerales bacterium]|nr:hypothetical protein [Sedimentisphaerales bacterium]